MAKAFIDAKRCQGHGRCALIAPQLFDVGDDGVGFVVADHIDAEDIAAAEEADLSCPEQAITLDA
jgi:ferredoxin